MGDPIGLIIMLTSKDWLCSMPILPHTFHHALARSEWIASRISSFISVGDMSIGFFGFSQKNFWRLRHETESYMLIALYRACGYNRAKDD